MVSCEYCGDSIDTLTYDCNYCSKSFCRSHRLPETHDCSRVSDARPPTSTVSGADATIDRSRGAKSVEEIDFRDSNIDLRELRERAKEEAEGQPYSVAEVQQTVGTTPDSDFDSSPDVAVDGSIKQEDTQQDATTDESSNTSPVSKRGVVVVLLILFMTAFLYVVFIL